MHFTCSFHFFLSQFSTCLSTEKSFLILFIFSDFTVFYRVLDDYDQETYLPLLSDWDLDAAFVR